MTTERLRVVELALLGLIVAASTWYCVAAAYALSATFDETTYLRLGLEHWRTGSCRALLRLGTLPLPMDMQTLPLWLHETWRGVPIDPVADIAWALPIARIAALPFWWLLLIYAWRTARALGGPVAGVLAATILACEPVFLAHAGLATGDVAVTACLLAFLFEFRAGRTSRWPRRVALPAVLYGIALLAKVSTLVFGVLGMLAVELERLHRSGALAAWRSNFRQLAFPLMRDISKIVAGGIVLAFIYCGSDWTTEPTFVQWAQSLPPGKAHDLMLWLAEHLRIFSNAGEALAQQIKHNLRGHHAYLLGEEYRRSIWYYFPVALTIKTTLPLLLLPVAIALVRGRSLWNWALSVAAILLLFSINCRVQIGVRFMLPLLAMVAIGGAAAAVEAAKSLRAPSRRLFGGCIAAGLAWKAVAAVAVWPQALCYTNAAWGGTQQGYRWLSDSNYDWGQGLLELREWCAAHDVETMDLWYFGTDLRATVAPFRLLPLQKADKTQGRPLEEFLHGRIIAVSTTFLYGAYLLENPAGSAAAATLRAQTPTARTTTYFIYDFRGERRDARQASNPPDRSE
jgi:hypothetical protein